MFESLENRILFSGDGLNPDPGLSEQVEQPAIVQTGHVSSRSLHCCNGTHIDEAVLT